MQVTAGSLTGAFGPQIERFSVSLVEQGLVHFIATDAHDPTARPPLMKAAFQRVAQLAGTRWPCALCRHPAAVVKGSTVPSRIQQPAKSAWPQWPPPTFSGEHPIQGRYTEDRT